MHRDPRADVIAFGVVVGGEDRLRIVVDADRAAGAEFQCRQRENAAAAAEIQHRAALQFAARGEVVQPLQAQRCRRVRARTESQAGIEPDHRSVVGIGAVRQCVIPRHDPGACAEVQRHVLVHPCTLPVLVFDLAKAGLRPVQAGIERVQRGQQQQWIGVGVEQRRQRHFAPDRHLADAGFEDRALVRRLGVSIEQCHRERADILKRVLIARLF